MYDPLKAVGCKINWADLQKPLRVNDGAVSANERYPLGQFKIAVWRIERDLTCCCSIVQHSDKLACSPRNYFANDEHSEGNIFHVCSCHFLE